MVGRWSLVVDREEKGVSFGSRFTIHDPRPTRARGEHRDRLSLGVWAALSRSKQSPRPPDVEADVEDGQCAVAALLRDVRVGDVLAVGDVDRAAAEHPKRPSVSRR